MASVDFVQVVLFKQITKQIVTLKQSLNNPGSMQKMSLHALLI